MTSPSLSARLFKLGIGLTLVVTGLAVTALLFIPYQRAKETRAWAETPCVITECYQKEAQSGDLAQTTHRVFISYRYNYKGEEHTASRVQRRTFAGEDDEHLSYKTPHASKADELVAKYPVNLATKCWVDPADPSDAVLEHQTKAAIYTLWWPMLFAVGGAGIAWSAVRREKKRPGGAAQDTIEQPAAAAVLKG